MTEDLIIKAAHYSRVWHGGQVRKYTHDPYWTHPASVARIVATVSQDEEVVAAAFLHDVLEDTSTTADNMRDRFGTKVTSLVLEVTDVSKPSDGNRAARKHLDLLHLAKSSPEGATIKLADLIDNTKVDCRI